MVLMHAVSEQWKVQECWSPSSGELELQPFVNSDVSEPSTKCNCVPFEGERGREACAGGTDNFCWNVQEENEQGYWDE